MPAVWVNTCRTVIPVARGDRRHVEDRFRRHGMPAGQRRRAETRPVYGLALPPNAHRQAGEVVRGVEALADGGKAVDQAGVLSGFGPAAAGQKGNDQERTHPAFSWAPSGGTIRLVVRC